MKLLLPIMIVMLTALAQAQDWATLRANALQSMVYVETVRQNRDGTNRETLTASGFVVSCFGHVLTVAHAVPREGANELVTYGAAVRSRHALKVRAEIVMRDENLDLALLQLPNVQAWKPLEFAPTDVVVGEDTRLYALGFPLHADLTSAEGLLSNRAGVSGRWQTTLPLNFGNSGGPVFDASGKVVAVAAGGFDQAQAITFVIPAEYLRGVRDLLPAGGCVQADALPGRATVKVPATAFMQPTNVALGGPNNVYGADVLLNGYPYDRPAPNGATWEFRVARGGTYLLKAEYAAFESRPVRVLLNGNLVFSEALAATTGCWTTNCQRTLNQGRVQLRDGLNVLRAERSNVFPHIRGWILEPVD